jgi:hypothetical protein
MSAVMETRPASAHGAPAPAAVARPVTLARVVRSEWTKLRALRSTWWCALIAVVLIVGLGAAIAGSGTPYKISAGNSAVGGVTVSLVGVFRPTGPRHARHAGVQRRMAAAPPRRLTTRKTARIQGCPSGHRSRTRERARHVPGFSPLAAPPALAVTGHSVGRRAGLPGFSFWVSSLKRSRGVERATVRWRDW